MNKQITDYIKTSFDIKEKILNNTNIISKIENITKKIIKAYKKGGKVLIAGNGGSAADAQHMAAELVSKFFFNRPGLSAIALTTDTSIITAIGNDYDYKKIFERQLQALGCSGDIFIGISTSGKSKNIIKAIEYCKQHNIFSILLTGIDKPNINCDICLNIPSNITPHIQESHLMIEHIICMLVEENIFKSCK